MTLDTNGLSAMADGDTSLEPLLQQAAEIAVQSELHSVFDAGLFQLRLKHFTDRRIFVFILDQVSTLPRARFAQTMSAPATSQSPHEPSAVAAPSRSQVAGRIATRVEVLMEPAVGRNKDRAFGKLDANVLRGLGVLDRPLP